MDETNTVRLNKFLAQCGLGSRRKCDELISGGTVFVNGIKTTELGQKINPLTDKVSFGLKECKPILLLEYFAYNKPKGVMVTTLDPEGRETIYDSFKRMGLECAHLKYIGRLDFNSEGLLLLTNDGALVHALTHPRFQIKKSYQITIDRVLEKDELRIMVTTGVLSNDQMLKAGRIERINAPNDQIWYEVDLYEGKNRQIRRMFEAFGYTITRLRRIQYASVKIGDLKTGAVRPLTLREIEALKHTGYPCK